MLMKSNYLHLKKKEKKNARKCNFMKKNSQSIFNRWDILMHIILVKFA